MLGRKGCWTLPQLMMELESKVKTFESRLEALENAHYYAYQHVLTCEGTYDGHSQVFYLTLTTASNEAFTGDTLADYLGGNDNNSYLATGYTHDDIAIVALEVDHHTFTLKLPDSSSYLITDLVVANDKVLPIQVK